MGTYGGDYLGTLDLPPEMAEDSDWTPPYPTVKPWKAWTILQHAVTGTPKIDRNRFDGTTAELRAAFGLALVAALPTPYPESATLTRVLRQGMQGPDVLNLQAMLNARGAGLTRDGIFGAKTEAAVRAWQKVKGLAVDGAVGRATWAALLGP